MTVDDATLRAAVDVLDGASAVALACHVDPDGDALGSMLALALALDRRGTQVVASWGRARPTDPEGLAIPPQYAFLPGLDLLVPPAAFPEAPDVMVVLDTGAPTRLGSLRPAAERAGTVVLIDHHAVGEPFGDLRLVEPDAAATAVIVDWLITAFGERLDPDVASCLYTALVTDTARFASSATTPRVHRLTARLLEAGIDHAAIGRQVWESASFGSIKVLGAALERARLLPDAGLVWTAVHQADLDHYGVSWEETEGIIEVLRRVRAAETTMVAKEQTDGTWKVSLRSRGHVDVGSLARALGGGGHRFSAALVAEGTLEEVVGRVRIGLLHPATAGARDA